MARAVVDARRTADRVYQVRRELADGGRAGEAEARVPAGLEGGEGVDVGTEGRVAKARAVVVFGRVVLDEGLRGGEDGEDAGDGGV